MNDSNTFSNDPQKRRKTAIATLAASGKPLPKAQPQKLARYEKSIIARSRAQQHQLFPGDRATLSSSIHKE
jgi:hypothetical protein